MNTKRIAWSAFAAIALLFAAIQFVPSPALLVPALLPPEQRSAHRLLNFEGIANFRDLGGYRTGDGRQVKWGVLYRSGTFADSTEADLRGLQQLGLATLIDFRSAAEKEQEPNHLPQSPAFELVDIPTLDGGDSSVATEIMARIESGNFQDFDPDQFMLEANRKFADTFTPQFRQFLHTVLNAGGAPVVWHCSAGKDRTGYAAAILLRILGVPQGVVLDDYALSREYALEARRKEQLLLRLFKGEEAAAKLAVLMGVEKAWLEAGFAEITANYGDFDNYVSQGLALSGEDVTQLRRQLLE